MESVDTILKPWENFYVIVGSAAAALTGLVFVVITIVSGDATRPRSKEGTAAFTTPTVVHFSTSLLIAIVLSVPWKWIVHPTIVLAVVGTFGAIYMIRTIARMIRLQNYDPDGEDVIWHATLPVLAYVVTAFGACALVAFPSASMFALALASVLLIFVGIHNAWDIVTFLAVDDTSKEPTNSPPPRKSG